MITKDQIFELVKLSETPLKDSLLEQYVTKYTACSKLIVDIPKYYRFLNLIAPHVESYIELGCCYGWACLEVLGGNPDIVIHGVDIQNVLCPEALKNHRLIFHKTQSVDLKLVNLFADNSIDLILIDSDHTYDTTKEEFKLWYPKVKQGGLILFDDVYYAEYGCTKFWNELEGNKIELPNLHLQDYGFGLFIK